jgi:hypothetical protein
MFRAKYLQNTDRGIAVLRDRRLGNLDLQEARVDQELLQCAQYVVREFLVAQLPGRDVNRSGSRV